MTKEDKELLLKDLSARLPYGVKIRIIYHEIKGADPEYVDDVFSTTHYNMIDYDDDNYEFLPYLRPMSSMTEDEKGNVNDIIDEFADRWLDSDVAKDKWDATFWQCSEIVNYLNSIHVDYRGLIPKGLAIEVTEENNPYKK